eukprot:376915-Amphidinium_carterae.1
MLRAVPIWAQERQWPHGMQGEFLGGHSSKKNGYCRGVECNNMHAMPRMPSLTWSTALQQASEHNATGINQTWVPGNHERDIFMLYMSARTVHGDREVRKKLKHICLISEKAGLPLVN